MNYEIIDGIKCYAPETAFSSTEFPAEDFKLLFDLEEKNFWFRSRNRLLIHLFKKYLNPESPKSILEIGCGTGYVLKALSQIESYRLTGAEIYIEGLKYARKRVPNIDFVQMDFRKTPYENEFDAIGAFDVLEHVEEDTQVINNVYKALKDNGLFFISVPQHKWLWSVQDEAACHKRRYSRREIKAKLESANFSIEFISSFVFALLPLMLLSRLYKKRKFDHKTNLGLYHNELKPPVIINAILERFMYIDEFLIKKGISLFFGGSLLVVARKKVYEKN